MDKFFSSLIWAMGIILMLGACSKPSTLGSELLEQDQEDVIFTDTIAVTTSTIIRDSVIAFTQDGPPTSMNLGYYADPIFGETKADIFMQITPGSPDFPVLEGTVIDSVILSLSIDSINTLGDFDENLQLEVFEMADSFDQLNVYYSNDDFPIDMMPLGTYDDQPSLTVDGTLKISNSESFVGKMMKIRLDNELGRRLIDSNTLKDFDAGFDGLNIKTVNSSPSDNLLSIFSENNGTAVTVYYTTFTDTDTVSNIYQFLLSPIDVRMNNLERNIAGTALENALNNPDGERLYLQGMSGPDIRIDLSEIQSLGSVLINKAELVFTVADDDGADRVNFPPTGQLILARLNDDDKFLGIDDFNFGGSFFGGDFDEDLDIPNAVQGTYSVLLSDYIQKVVDGDEDSIVFLRALPKINTSKRAILYGSASNEYAPKLKLTYTRINQ